MNLIQYTLFLFFIVFISTNTSNAQKWGGKFYRKVEVTRTIIVDQTGRGNFIKLQDAINSVPSNNNAWIKIHLKAGVYTEKVHILSGQEFIFLEGEDDTVIQFGDYGPTNMSSTFSVYASNFVASNIIFKNTYNEILATSLDGAKMTWAPAIRIEGDKSAFYKCAFISLQDTLADMFGRHYFKSCYIEGALDFIWGDGQSIYESCDINIKTALLPPGDKDSYITAQGREAERDQTGFVFKGCHIFGTGPAYLGRAWKKYSRVIYYNCTMDNIIRPKGWSEWKQHGPDGFIKFAEIGNTGPGSDMSQRVKWEAKLTPKAVQSLVNLKYINQGNWLQQQPLGSI